MSDEHYGRLSLFEVIAVVLDDCLGWSPFALPLAEVPVCLNLMQTVQQVFLMAAHHLPVGGWWQRSCNARRRCFGPTTRWRHRHLEEPHCKYESMSNVFSFFFKTVFSYCSTPDCHGAFLLAVSHHSKHSSDTTSSGIVKTNKWLGNSRIFSWHYDYM